MKTKKVNDFHQWLIRFRERNGEHDLTIACILDKFEEIFEIYANDETSSC